MGARLFEEGGGGGGRVRHGFNTFCLIWTEDKYSINCQGERREGRGKKKRPKIKGTKKTGTNGA